MLAATPDNYPISGHKLFRDRVEKLDFCMAKKKSAEVGGGTYNIRRLVFGGKCVFIRSTLWGGEWVLAATHKRYPNFGHSP